MPQPTSATRAPTARVSSANRSSIARSTGMLSSTPTRVLRVPLRQHVVRVPQLLSTGVTSPQPPRRRPSRGPNLPQVASVNTEGPLSPPTTRSLQCATSGSRHER